MSDARDVNRAHRDALGAVHGEGTDASDDAGALALPVPYTLVGAPA